MRRFSLPAKGGLAFLLLIVVLLSTGTGPASSLLRATLPQKPQPANASLAASDEAFLEDLSRRSFRYFWEQADARTGLVRDRARTDGSIHDEAHRNIASIAATGFGL